MEKLPSPEVETAPLPPITLPQLPTMARKEPVIVKETRVEPPKIEIPGFTAETKLPTTRPVPRAMAVPPSELVIDIPKFKVKRAVPKPSPTEKTIPVPRAQAPVVDESELITVAKEIDPTMLKKEKSVKDGYTLEQIKAFARLLKIKVSGTKAEVIDRIVEKRKELLGE
jgi:hypothetical protein